MRSGQFELDERLTSQQAKKKEHGEDEIVDTWSGKRRQWYLNGLLHRTDGPAVIWSDGYKAWFIDGQLHREDGPAIIWPNGRQQWYLNGLLHRTDGPAAIWPNGQGVWYLNGTELPFDEWCDRVGIDEKTRTFLRLKYA